MINIDLVKRKYQRNAYFYDFVTQAFSGIRTQAISQLKLSPGEVVLDFGCGTGLSFALIERFIGPKGRIIGVERSPAMLEKARQKIIAHQWGNIDLIESNAEQVDLEPNSVDDVLSFYTHDIMSSAQAMGKAVRALRPGGKFIAAGSKLAGNGRKWLLNRLTLAYANTAITVLLTTQPWNQLKKILGSLEVQEKLLGSAYIAYGVKAY